MLIRACAPALTDLLEETVEPQMILPFGDMRPSSERITEFLTEAEFADLPKGHQKRLVQAIETFSFLAKKPDQSLAPAFTALLGPVDDAALALMLKVLEPVIPGDPRVRVEFFEPEVVKLPAKVADIYRRNGSNLRRTLIDRAGTSPIGLLRWCLQQPREKPPAIGGIFAHVHQRFAFVGSDDYKLVCRINTFRNDYVAHQTKELTDVANAKGALTEWVRGLVRLWVLQRGQ